MKILTPQLSWLAAFFLFCVTVAPEASAQWWKKKHKRAIDSGNLVENAVGVVEFFPFEKRDNPLRCAAFHLGHGMVATAGHCFLGAWDCNGAVVKWSNSALQSRCISVLYSNASEAYSNGREVSSDLTVFKVDSAPAHKIFLTGSRHRLKEPADLDVVTLQLSQKNGKWISQRSPDCILQTGAVSNIFGQPKPSDTARHSCILGDYSDGSPILDAKTGALLALHQAVSQIPAFTENGSGGESTLKEINYGKTLQHLDLDELTQQGPSDLRDMRVGGFSGEVFSIGLREKLSMRVVTLPARNSAENLSFLAHNGLDTTLEVIGADGKKMVFTGPRRAGFEQRFSFKAPVSIVVKGTHTGIAPSAWIEDIESQ